VARFLLFGNETKKILLTQCPKEFYIKTVITNENKREFFSLTRILSARRRARGEKCWYRMIGFFFKLNKTLKTP
jgi:hypothetical protein